METVVGSQQMDVTGLADVESHVPHHPSHSPCSGEAHMPRPHDPSHSPHLGEAHMPRPHHPSHSPHPGEAHMPRHDVLLGRASPKMVPNQLPSTVDDWAAHLMKKSGLITEADFQDVPAAMLSEVREMIAPFQKHRKIDSQASHATDEMVQQAALMHRITAEMVTILTKSAQQAVSIAALRKQAKENLLQALDAGPAQVRSRKRNAQLRTMSMLVFFVVLAGCELDFIGFAMAFQEYWFFEGEGSLVIKGMLVAMPASFLLAILLYMNWATEGDDGPQVPAIAGRSQQASAGCALNFPPTSQSSTFNMLSGGAAGAVAQPQAQPQVVNLGSLASNTERRARRLVVREKINVQFYHFLPLCRTYLVVKSIDDHDVEAIFRVNSLSSFTLGLAQLVAMVFTIFMPATGVLVDNNSSITNDSSNAAIAFNFSDLPLVVKINMGSFLLNFSITLLYFGTPIASILKRCIEMDALKYNLDKGMKKRSTELLQAAKDDAEKRALQGDRPGGGSASQCSTSQNQLFGFVEEGDTVSFIKSCLKFEIQFMHGVNADMRWFTVGDLIEIQTEVYRKQIEMHGM